MVPKNPKKHLKSLNFHPGAFDVTEMFSHVTPPIPASILVAPQQFIVPKLNRSRPIKKNQVHFCTKCFFETPSAYNSSVNNSLPQLKR